MRFITCLFTLLVLAVAYSQREMTVNWKKVGTSSVKLLINDRSYGQMVDFGDGVGMPTAKAFLMPNGDVVGSIEQINNGAFLQSIVSGFIIHNKRLNEIDDVELVACKGNYALFLPVIEGMPPQSSGCDHAKLYHAGKTEDIGLVRRFTLSNSGSVTGWYPMNNGKPFEGQMEGDTYPLDDTQHPITRMYFKVKSHKRTESLSPIK